MGNTLRLAALAALVSVPLALVLGMLAALYRNSWFDRLLNTSALSAVSFPEFFVAYLLILVFSVKLGWFPSLSNLAPDASFGTILERSVLPVATLSLVVIAQMMRMTRASLINLLASPYIEMARLKGISQSRIIWRHALPNALAPIVNVIALNLAYLVVGVVVVEVVFVYPGLGQLLVDSVSKRDIPVVQACSLIFAATYILLNTGADVLSIATKPTPDASQGVDHEPSHTTGPGAIEREVRPADHRVVCAGGTVCTGACALWRNPGGGRWVCALERPVFAGHR